MNMGYKCDTAGTRTRNLFRLKRAPNHLGHIVIDNFTLNEKTRIIHHSHQMPHKCINDFTTTSALPYIVKTSPSAAYEVCIDKLTSTELERNSPNYGIIRYTLHEMKLQDMS